MPALRTVLRVVRCGSTMDEARTLAESGAADGAVIAALVAALDRWTGALRGGERDAIIESSAAAMAFAPGGRIVLSDATGTFAGVWRGLAAAGRLVVDREGAAAALGAGDVRVLEWA
jgi:biotin-(acetyl-CoA carboxylase) ligase